MALIPKVEPKHEKKVVSALARGCQRVGFLHLIVPIFVLPLRRRILFSICPSGQALTE
jgi:hypothetical protein